MPDTIDAAAALLAAAAQEGPGDTLRIVLLGSIVGAVLLAWFLLRGYRAGDAATRTDGDAGTDDNSDANTDDNANA